VLHCFRATLSGCCCWYVKVAINDEAALECVMLFWKWTESIYFWYLNLGKNIEAALENIILFLKIPGVSLRYLKLAINDYNT